MEPLSAANQPQLNETESNEPQRKPSELMIPSMNNKINRNRKKRKLDIDDMESPKRPKKRKLNDKKIEDRLKYLYEENIRLIKERRRYKRERDHFEKTSNYYKLQMNYYQNAYINIKNTVNKCWNNNNNNNDDDDDDDDDEDDDLHNNKNEELSINTDNGHIINNNLESISNNTDDELSIHSSPSNTDNEHNLGTIPSSGDATWKTTHIFSVKCHFCAQSFDDEDEYIAHLQTEYKEKSGKRRKWLQCERRKCGYIGQNKVAFIAHIASHTGDKMYHCIVKENGIKCDKSDSYKHNLETHINKTHYNKEQIVKSAKRHSCALSINQQKTKEILSLPSLEPIHQEMEDEHDDNDDNDDESVPISDDEESEVPISDNYSWKDVHYISVNCKYCKDGDDTIQHFDDLDEYIQHLKLTHFNKDDGQIWLKCDQCYKSSLGTDSFLSHLSVHGHPSPYHCKVKDVFTGKKCKFSASAKCNLITHLRARKHGITLISSKKNKKRINKKKHRKNKGRNSNKTRKRRSRRLSNLKKSGGKSSDEDDV